MDSKCLCIFFFFLIYVLDLKNVLNEFFYLKFIFNVDFMCIWCICVKIVKIKKKKLGYSVSSLIFLSEEVIKKGNKKMFF